MKYEHLFFDLDHTLWDFDKNSSESLEEIFHSQTLHQHGVHSCDDFISSFLKINAKLWNDFDTGQIHHTYIRQNRFRLVFESLGLACPDNHLEIGELYLQTLPDKKHLLEGASQVLDYVTAAGYKLHIITNGFNEVQARKLSGSEISHYFEHVITFENAQAKKPDPRIFEYALSVSGAKAGNSLMIGDNWIADVMGAKQAGLDTVYYNPAGLTFDQTPTYDIRKLDELLLIL
ncbi:YjjG family noncanonical pyrimidine nucleotidase [Dyadobacter sandarakinus]|uniref:Noncanonical pyrimidine nucleotidase, YjjG family n=1 Tax=Dyadobacter sandarakinus TaxID=2747268 RepID=A0ABX7IDS8_9BACT|nr:YjjG family noncanonical pyrimidine nucleotidase [Dyadobacter sandarakinus]QRR03051.1 noncanonical pyrimidine nucleotidase, YjjG family [Dyadobacter sandarakinus]